jgi:RimJ/RimL family protein N-acetyltransferase
VVAYASIAVDGPWRNKPTLYELYVMPDRSSRAHYNPPYGDIYMEVDEAHRRRGYGCYLVQELKRLCRELGGVPGARCFPTNAASRRTLQRAGFVPYAHILIGAF